MNLTDTTPLDSVAHVECGSCSACCRRELVALVEGDDPAIYPLAYEMPPPLKKAVRDMIPISIGWAIPHDKATGACVYLKDDKCSIYDHRPKICKSFTCVGWVRNIKLALPTRAEQRRAIRSGQVDKEIWKAGVERTPK